MRKIVALVALAFTVGDAFAQEKFEFNNLDEAIMFARFRSAADNPDGVQIDVNGKKVRKDNQEQPAPRLTHQEYLIDGIKVLVTSDFKGNVVVPKAKEKFDPNKAAYMDECISLTQNMDMCKQLWNERQK